MTLTAAVSHATQLLKIVPREYEVFGGLDVDHHNIVATFADHGKLMTGRRKQFIPPPSSFILAFHAFAAPVQRCVRRGGRGSKWFRDRYYLRTSTCLLIQFVIASKYPAANTGQ
jgi:hypothetical protein